jgi:hypothetical protein
MHKTNQELLDTINLHTGNSIPSTSHCIPLYKHDLLVAITAIEPLGNGMCNLHLWTIDPTANWATRSYMCHAYEYIFEHYTTLVARIPHNLPRVVKAARNTGYTLCYTSDQYACYTYTREQYQLRFSRMLKLL